MNSRQKAMSIFNRQSNGEGCMWTGHPNDKTIPIYAEKWGIEPTREAIFEYLNDDCRWFMPTDYYKHPLGLPEFDGCLGQYIRTTPSSAGYFDDDKTIAEIEAYNWPNPEYCDFSHIYTEIDKHPDKMIFTGSWSQFFHLMCDFFGMENYFVMMHENPMIVEAATEKIVDYYVGINEKFFKGLGDRADVMAFGNDFGTQLDLLISPDNFRKFLLPSIKRIIAVGKKYNKKIMLHSCGSIYRVIPDLIDAGVDILHPIQAQAQGMSAIDLVQYKNDLSFIGGIDAQTFFVTATPAQIKDEVRRVREVLGPNIVISPSHEEILPNIPAENVVAMAEAARE